MRALFAALLLALPALADEPLRHASLGGQPLAFPAAALGDHARAPINVLVTAEARVLLSTLMHRGWSLHLRMGAEAQHALLHLGGKLPAFELEHSGARIDEQLKLYVWRRHEKVRGLPVWLVAPVRLTGLLPLQPATRPPEPSSEAHDRLLADLSFALAQTRSLTLEGAPRVAWVELAAAPEGAEELVPEPGDLQGANAPMLEGIAAAAQPDAGPQAVSLPDGGAFALALPDGGPLLAANADGGAPEHANTPLHLAVAESVQSAVAGIHALAPLPQPAQVPAVSISRPERAGKRVALTFDACSTLDRSFYDERVMKVLRETQTPATLFISGRWAETHQQIVRDLAADPLFEIANHSYVHPHMLEMPMERQEHELLWTQQILLTLTGKVPRFFRPPYGEMNDELVRVAAGVGLRTVEYDFPSGDPDKNITKERMVKWVVAKARPGSIIVMHMNRHGWHTGEALPDIVRGLRARGFELARVGDLVDADAAAGQ